MKKKICVLLGITAITFSLMTGCGSEAEQQSDPDGAVQQNQEEQEQLPEESEKESGEEAENTEDESERTDEDNAENAETMSVNLYYVDGETAEITTKIIDVSSENDIWANLQEAGILTDECELLSFSVNTEEKTIDLDFNKATGDRIRSMGTTGETEIIGCIVNTYLEAYQCERIRLTEEGETLQSSHAEYDGYCEFYEF